MCAEELINKAYIQIQGTNPEIYKKSFIIFVRR